MLTGDHVRRFRRVALAGMTFAVLSGCDPQVKQLITDAGAIAFSQLGVAAVQLFFSALGLPQAQTA